MHKFTETFLATALALALAPQFAGAQVQDSGYLVDVNGRVALSGTGLCWRDAEWTSASRAPVCDPMPPRVAEAAPAPAPAPVATPAPAAIAPPPAAAPLQTKLSFSADALFAFDKSELKPEGRAMLDGLVRQLKDASYDVISLTGHADRFGTDAYNQKLSERRAAAVKDYLVGQNVRANRIDAEGKGETQPVTAAGACPGPRSAKVIACLQPDRRVDVEMTGTQAVATAR
jgi:OOP family OmpA-OmpF porin